MAKRQQDRDPVQVVSPADQVPPGPSRAGGAADRHWPSNLGDAAFRDGAFVRRVLIVIALGALTALVWRLAHVLLLAFGAVVVAVILRALADLIARCIPATKKWSLALAGLMIVMALGVTLFLFGRQVRAQLGELARIFPPALEYVLGEFGVDTRKVLEQLPKVIGSGLPQEIFSRVASYSMTIIGALADLLLVLVAGVFLAADPTLYKRGVVQLFPSSQHEGRERARYLRSGIAIVAQGAARRNGACRPADRARFVAYRSPLASWAWPHRRIRRVHSISRPDSRRRACSRDCGEPKHSNASLDGRGFRPNPAD
jgi:hypothetical protein